MLRKFRVKIKILSTHNISHVQNLQMFVGKLQFPAPPIFTLHDID